MDRLYFSVCSGSIRADQQELDASPRCWRSLFCYGSDGSLQKSSYKTTSKRLRKIKVSLLECGVAVAK